MIEDNNGALWIGTDAGLCKYLGNGKFYTYYSNFNDNSLLDDNIYSLMQDSTGLIWVGTYTGINIFEPNERRCLVHFADFLFFLIQFFQY